MPEQATLSNECVVDRRRRSRRTGETSPRPSSRAASAKKPKKKVESEVEDLELDDEELVERRQVERRRQIDPTTCERDYGDDEVEFMNAMDDYKRRSGRPFPTWSEVLEVIRDVGYRKVAEPTQTYSGEESN